MRVKKILYQHRRDPAKGVTIHIEQTKEDSTHA